MADEGSFISSVLGFGAPKDDGVKSFVATRKSERDQEQYNKAANASSLAAQSAAVLAITDLKSDSISSNAIGYMSTADKQAAITESTVSQVKVKPNKSNPGSSQVVVPVQDFPAKDAYRHSEVSPNNYVRAAIDDIKAEDIVEIKIKRVPKLQPTSKDVVDNLFKPGGVGGYAHFFIQSIQTPKQERVQIMETFTTSWIYLFGQMTPIYTFSGILLNYRGGKTSSTNTEFDTHNWATDFMKVYDEQMRGTKTVEAGGILELAFDNVLVQGYMLNSNLMRNSATPYGVPFSFSLAIVKESYTGFGVFFSNQLDTKTTDPVAEKAASPSSPLSSFVNSALNKVNSYIQMGTKIA